MLLPSDRAEVPSEHHAEPVRDEAVDVRRDDSRPEIHQERDEHVPERVLPVPEDDVVRRLGRHQTHRVVLRLKRRLGQRKIRTVEPGPEHHVHVRVSDQLRPTHVHCVVYFRSQLQRLSAGDDARIIGQQLARLHHVMRYLDYK